MHVHGQETGHNHANENSRWCGVYPSIVAVSQTKQTVDLGILKPHLLLQMAWCGQGCIALTVFLENFTVDCTLIRFVLVKF